MISAGPGQRVTLRYVQKRRLKTTKGASPVTEQPLWVSVADQLRAKISSGEYPPGATLPSENELSGSYGVSRETMRKALGQLTHEGLLGAGRGRLGRQVREARPIIFYAMQSESPSRIAQRQALGQDAWTLDVADQGHEGSQAITVAIEEAEPEIAHRLGLQVGDAVVVRRRVRTVDGKPHNIADTYYPHWLAKGTAIEHPADVRQGTIALLTELGWPQLGFRDELTTRMPTPEEADQLLIPPGVPVLIQHRTGYTCRDAPIKVTVTVWPGDRAGLQWDSE